MLLRLLLSLMLVIGLTGCATHKKGAVKETKETLKVRVSELETELQKKDERITGLEDQLQKSTETQGFEQHRNYSSGTLSNKD
ncbi:MAG: hypothetical protein PHS37_09080, partial [Candidatus Omnitrophica bacterium]|nr:hypothetical protein [Candidatus Omnitrophota bacterium]